MGDTDYFFREDPPGEFVTGHIRGDIIADGADMSFTLTISNVGGRMVADFVASADKKSLAAANKARRVMMESITLIPK